MLQKIMTRLKNPKVFMAVVSGILMILVNLGLVDVEMSTKVENIVNTILSFGVAIGIFADPESHVKK
jgi:uncharacterized membrane protein